MQKQYLHWKVKSSALKIERNLIPSFLWMQNPITIEIVFIPIEMLPPFAFLWLSQRELWSEVVLIFNT